MVGPFAPPEANNSTPTREGERLASLHGQPRSHPPRRRGSERSTFNAVNVQRSKGRGRTCFTAWITGERELAPPEANNSNPTVNPAALHRSADESRNVQRLRGRFRYCFSIDPARAATNDAVMRILHVGDIVGSPGRLAFNKIAVPMKQRGEIDALVVNAENTAGGRGITAALAEDLLNAGADVLTMGDHTWDQRDLMPFLDVESRIIRPMNFAPGCPGRGWTTVETDAGPLTVMQAIGRVFMQPSDCPFRAIDALFKQGMEFAPVILMEMHAEATSEKVAMGWHLDGRVTSVVGTHTHVQTSDERILPGGTAYLTDLGMTGPKDSVIGRTVDTILPKFLTNLPAKFEVAKGSVALEGALIETGPDGKAISIERVRTFIDDV